MVTWCHDVTTSCLFHKYLYDIAVAIESVETQAVQYVAAALAPLVLGGHLSLGPLLSSPCELLMEGGKAAEFAVVAIKQVNTLEICVFGLFPPHHKSERERKVGPTRQSLPSCWAPSKIITVRLLLPLCPCFYPLSIYLSIYLGSPRVVLSSISREPAP